MEAPFHYSNEFLAKRRKAIIFGVLAIVLAVIVSMCLGTINEFNESCAGPSCDGSHIEECTPKTAPTLFGVLIVVMGVAIGFAITSIYYIVQAKRLKIPIYYTNEELAHKVIYVNAYYKYQRAQIIFTIIVSLLGQLLMSELIVILDLLSSMLEYEQRFHNRVDDIGLIFVIGGIVCGVTLSIIGLFTFLMIKNIKLKKKNAIRVTQSAFTGYSNDRDSYTY